MQLGGPKLSVGFPFFNRTFVPLMVPLLLAVGSGRCWPGSAAISGRAAAALGAFAAALAVVLVALYIARGGPVLAVLGLGACRLGWSRGRSPNGPSACACSARGLAESARRARHLPRAPTA